MCAPVYGRVPCGPSRVAAPNRGGRPRDGMPLPYHGPDRGGMPTVATMSIRERLRLVFRGADVEAPTTDDPALPSAPTTELEVVAYAEDCRLFGHLALSAARLTDMLNEADEIELVDVAVEALADGGSSRCARWSCDATSCSSSRRRVPEAPANGASARDLIRSRSDRPVPRPRPAPRAAHGRPVRRAAPPAADGAADGRVDQLHGRRVDRRATSRHDHRQPRGHRLGHAGNGR